MFLRTRKVVCWLGLSALILVFFFQKSAYCQNDTATSSPPVIDNSQPSAAPLVNQGEGTAIKNDASGEFFENYIQGKLQIGTRSVYRALTNADSGHKGGTAGSGTWLGTIYALDEEQSYVPNKVFLNYYFSKYFGIEMAYDSIKVETLAMDVDTHKEKTDGDATLYGPTLSLLARIPNSTSFTPYFGLGLGFFKGTFDEDPAWAYTRFDFGGRVREMAVENTTAVLFTSGVAWAFTTNWLLDCSLQYVKADPDVIFYGYTNGVQNTAQPGHFPMDNVAFRLGIAYSF